MGSRFLGRKKVDLMCLHGVTSEMNAIDCEGMEVPEPQRDCQSSEHERKPGILMQLGQAAPTGSEQEFEAQWLIMSHTSDQFGTRKPTTPILKAT